ncbi:MAG: cysteine hydrolase [Rhodobacteraceae bacterium]|nr:cysteine hydrolase [Paracoccaceae bacterium]
MTFDPARSALLTIDLQNDFLHPDGAYGRAGQTAEAIAALPARIAPLAAALRAKGGTYISAQFTLVPGPGGAPLIAPHLKKLRPFLGKGDFAPGAWGHGLVDDLAPADYTVEKVAYSALYQTRLEYILRALEIDTLIVGGIVTNGGVASTVRDAHLRNIHTILLSDGSAAFKGEVHEATLVSLGSVTPQMTCAQMLEALT